MSAKEKQKHRRRQIMSNIRIGKESGHESDEKERDAQEEFIYIYFTRFI